MGLDDFDIEPSKHEPKEWDPEADFQDPNSDSITIPQVETDESDVPPDLLRTFWLVVLVLNGAVLAVSLGLMILYFWGDVRRGGALLAGGAVLFALAYYRYKRFRASDEGETDADTDDTAPSSTPTESDDADTGDADDTTDETEPGAESGTNGDERPSPSTDHESHS